MQITLGSFTQDKSIAIKNEFLHKYLVLNS